MSEQSLYDDDVLVWAERQAEILRDLGRTRRDLPNDFDIDNVAEEIESVGRDQLQAVENFIRLMLLHAIKIASAPRSDTMRSWRGEILNFHAEAVSRLTPSMPGRLDLERAWRRATNQASDALAIWGDPVVPLPKMCPVPLDALLAERIDIDGVIAFLVPGEEGGAPDRA